jgi:hypothetical protein
MRMNLDSENRIRVAKDYRVRGLDGGLSNVELNAHFRGYFAAGRVRGLSHGWGVSRSLAVSTSGN